MRSILIKDTTREEREANMSFKAHYESGYEEPQLR